MSPLSAFTDLTYSEIFQTLLPDFVLAFAFFTALAYAILGKRFGHQRSAVAMSAALGFALSVGLTWWEEQSQHSIRDLGPLAVGFAIVMLGIVMFQALRQAGGSWAGAGIAIGASLVVSELLGMHWMLSQQIIQTVTTAALVVGILAFLMHARGHADPTLPRVVQAPVEAGRRHGETPRGSPPASDLLGARSRHLQRQMAHVRDHPTQPPDIAAQIKRMLPAEGWLTERMADLRARAYQAREGQVARINEIRQELSRLPPASQKYAASELAARYKELKLDLRIDRLDKAAAENERRILLLTRQAQQAMDRYEYPRLLELLRDAEKLQKHNSHLFKIMERTEHKLTGIAKAAAQQAQEVNDH